MIIQRNTVDAITKDETRCMVCLEPQTLLLPRTCLDSNHWTCLAVVKPFFHPSPTCCVDQTLSYDPRYIVVLDEGKHTYYYNLTMTLINKHYTLEVKQNFNYQLYC